MLCNLVGDTIDNTFAKHLWMKDNRLSRVNRTRAGNVTNDGSNNMRSGQFGKQFIDF